MLLILYYTCYFYISSPEHPTIWASECPDVKNYKWRLNPVWHETLYSCTHVNSGHQRAKLCGV